MLKTTLRRKAFALAMIMTFSILLVAATALAGKKGRSEPVKERSKPVYEAYSCTQFIKAKTGGSILVRPDPTVWLDIPKNALESNTVISATMQYKTNSIEFVFGPCGTSFSTPMELKVFWAAAEELDDFTLYGASEIEPEICEWGLLYRIPHFSLYYYRRR